MLFFLEKFTHFIIHLFKGMPKIHFPLMYISILLAGVLGGKADSALE